MKLKLNEWVGEVKNNNNESPLRIQISIRWIGFSTAPQVCLFTIWPQFFIFVFSFCLFLFWFEFILFLGWAR